tara:strand:- start:114 stop:854 length:741 start_codon:yes stop_codon:yes gene_type:complete
MKNKTVILIGSEGLIGKNFKNFLLNKNFNILCLDIKKKPNHKISNKIIYLKKNVNNPKALLEAIKLSDKKFAGIDYVIDCSYPSMIVDRKTKRNNYQLLKKSISNNISSPIMICEIFCEYFKNKKKSGNLILLSSIQGVMAPKFKHYLKTNMNSPVEYTALKFGIVGIVKYFAKLYGEFNINVNCISPGGILNKQPKIFIKNYKNDCLVKGMLDPDDLNSALEFLMNENSKMVNGQNLIIDDGWSL